MMLSENDSHKGETNEHQVWFPSYIILIILKVRSVGGEPEDTKEIGHRSTTTVEVVFYLFFCLFFVFVFLGGGLTQQDILFHPVISQLSVIVRKHYLNY